MSRRPLEPADILAEGHNSFGYYQLLPSDKPLLARDWPVADLAQLGLRMTARVSDTLNESDIDALSLALLALGDNEMPTDINWHDVATGLSLLYANQLRSGGRRQLRMKAARANFYLRDCLDRVSIGPQSLIDERRFPEPFVWDWMPLANGELIADSSEHNVCYPEADGTASARMGLPTQIDDIGAGRYAVSSCYSDGWYLWSRQSGYTFHGHSRPVVLVFCVQDDVLFLDRDGGIYQSQTGKVVSRIGVEAVWRARLIGTDIFVSDWGDPQRLYVVDTNNWKCAKTATGPVLLTNDVCRSGDQYYVVDKMQGQVFSFDSAFSPLGARMSFGKKRGQLYDPITLRVHEGGLHILSWLTGALATIKPF